LVSLAKCRSAVACYGFKVDTVVQHYLEWVVVPFYVLIVGWNPFKGDYDYAVFQSAKRGDEKYSCKVMRRFGELKQRLEDKTFFSFGERDRKKIESSVVYATLTYKREIELEDTWRYVSSDFNKWITRLRRRFGKIDVLRCFESQEDGYCHVHAVLLLREAKFRGFRRDKFKDGKRIITYRVDQVEPFKAGWRGGFVDVQLCNSVKGAFYYISKYLAKSVSKDEEGGKAVKTLALSWYFRKRSFSVSGGFAEVYSDLIIDRDNSNLFVPYVLTFDGKKIECEVSKWHLYGFVKGDHVKWAKNFRKMELSEINDLEEKGLIERPERYSYG